MSAVSITRRRALDLLPRRRWSPSGRSRCSTCSTRRAFATAPIITEKELKDTDNRFDILFCGSDSFSVASLNSIIHAGDVWRSIRVLAPPVKGDAKKRALQRAKTLAPSLRDYATDDDLPLDLVPSEGIKGYIPSEPFTQPHPQTVLVTSSFGYILPDSFLDLFHPANRLNVHPSLLPRWRGAAPIQWTIAAGDTTTGVSVQNLVSKTDGIDAGGLVGVKEGIAVPSTATYWSLLPPLAAVGGDLLVDVLRRMRDGTITAIPQSGPAKRAPKITHDTARISFSTQTAHQLDRLARGISHQEPLWTTMPHTSKQIQLLDITAPPLSSLPQRVSQQLYNTPPGTAVINKGTKKLYIACYSPLLSPTGDDEGVADEGEDLFRDPQPTILEVSQVRLQGRSGIDAWAWWNGLRWDRETGNVLTFV